MRIRIKKFGVIQPLPVLCDAGQGGEEGAEEKEGRAEARGGGLLSFAGHLGGEQVTV